LLWLERQSMAASHAVITTNESYKSIAVERDGMKAEDLFIVRSGPRLGSLTVYPRDERYFAGKAHLLVYLGEICKQDGVDYMVRAVKLLREKLGRNDVHCLFIGGGPHQPAIKAYAEEQGIMDFAEFTGRISDEELCRILSSATLAIDPDPKNAWSDKSTMNKVIEYMYFGVPVVAFDLHETRVSAGEAGAYAEANSEHDMARVVSELLDDPERRAAMGELGKRRVREELAWDFSIPSLLAAYDHALARRGLA